MKGQILQLIFKETNAYLSLGRAYSLHDLKLNNMISSFKRPAFWTLRVIEVFQQEKRLHTEILSYNTGNTEFSEFQKKHHQELERYQILTFKSVDTAGVYASAKNDERYKSYTPTQENFTRDETSKSQTNAVIIPPQIQQPIISTETEEFFIDFNKIKFMLGYISFTAYTKKFGLSVDFKIYNDNLLPEFDNIKFWFSKKMNLKKIKVRATYKLTDNKLTEWSAMSSEIDSINSELIESVKLQRTLQIVKTFRPEEIDKSLFTSDDIYTLYNENELLGNVFKQTEIDILDILLEETDVRNKKELRYLSGKIHSTSYRIRFSNHPNFGFIFLNEGELNNHFIWELLNTNATYVWTFDKGDSSLEIQYKRIEKTINTILLSKREAYKRAYKSQQIDSDLIFNAIYHKDKDSEFIDSFPRWKQKINALLT